MEKEKLWRQQKIARSWWKEEWTGGERVFRAVKILGGFFGGSAVKNLPASAGDAGSIPGSGRSPEGNIRRKERKEVVTHSMFLPGESCGQRILVGYSPRGHKE